MARVFAQTQDCHQPEARQPAVIAGTLQAVAGPDACFRARGEPWLVASQDQSRRSETAGRIRQTDRLTLSDGGVVRERTPSRLIETLGRRCGPGRDGSESGRGVKRSW